MPTPLRAPLAAPQAGDEPTPAPQPRRLPASVHLLVLAGYTLLTLLMTNPIAGRLGQEVIGGGDAWQNIWNLWWIREAIFSGPQNPYFTDYLYYPDGAPLYLHTLVLTAGLISLPFQLLGLNLVATYNLVLLLTFPLAGYGAFLLCHYVTGHRWGSFVGGCVFTFAPYHFAHLYGHMNLSSIQWLPFFVLLLLRAIDEPGRAGEGNGGRRRLLRSLLPAVGAGALLALNVYTDWIYGIFAGIFTALVLLWKLLLPDERRALAARGVGWREAGLRLAAGGLVALLMIAPILIPTMRETARGYAQQPYRETLVYSSDLSLAFLPSELHPLWGKQMESFANRMEPYTPLKHPSERTVFLGYSVLALAGLGLWRLRRDRRAWMWGALAGVTWLLTLGPVLQVLGKSAFTVFGVQVPLPYLALYQLPLLNIMRTPSRLTVLVMLALGVLVALVIASFASRTRPDEARVEQRGWRFDLAHIAIPVLILFEFWAAPFTTVPPGWNVPVYAQLAQEEGDFAVLELPLRPFSDYMAYQTIHGKPLVGGYIARQPPYLTADITPALRYLRDATPSADPLRDAVSGGKGAQSLRDLKVRYVIIRWWAFTEEARADMRAKLDLLFGRPPDQSWPEHMVDVWKLY
jgi:hypothetical protein